MNGPEVRRVLLVVLDGLGVGGRDPVANSFEHALASDRRAILTPFLDWLGLRHVGLEKGEAGIADWGRMRQDSRYNESYSAHWEMAGIEDFDATGYPGGFPLDFVARLEGALGSPTIGNVATYTRFGETPPDVFDEHLRTGFPILVGESMAEPVAVVALYARQDVIAQRDLFTMVLRAARELEGDSVIGRLCARSYVGAERVPVVDAQRLDVPFFKLTRYPLMDAIRASGRDCVATGKVAGLFGNRSFTQFSSRWGDENILSDTLWALESVRDGLVWANFNTLNRPAGANADTVAWLRALEGYDTSLRSLYERLSDDDLMIVTGDHGVDPTLDGRHTWEEVPLLVVRGGRTGDVSLGRPLGRRRHADIASTIARLWHLDALGPGSSFEELLG